LEWSYVWQPLEDFLLRDPARIDRMLAKVRALWYTNTDARLLQLLLNNTPNSAADQYHFEDDKLEKAIDESLKRIS
jgi:hypothetical protein